MLHKSLQKHCPEKKQSLQNRSHLFLWKTWASSAAPSLPRPKPFPRLEHALLCHGPVLSFSSLAAVCFFLTWAAFSNLDLMSANSSWASCSFVFSFWFSARALSYNCNAKQRTAMSRAAPRRADAAAAPSEAAGRTRANTTGLDALLAFSQSVWNKKAAV